MPRHLVSITFANKFSTVDFLLNVLYKNTIELTFENFCQS